MRLHLIRVIALTTVAAFALFPQRLCAAPDIALRMTVDVAVPIAGQPVQFTVTARNIGTDTATGVQVTDSCRQPHDSIGDGCVSEHRDVRRGDRRLVDRVAGRGCQPHW